jgi:signal transduction histidine kinase
MQVDLEERYETRLKDISKSANIYIRDLSSKNKLSSIDQLLFYEANDISMELSRDFDVHVFIYNMKSSKIGTSIPLYTDIIDEELLSKGLDDKIAYLKKENEIDYVAPIYYKDSQVGVIRIILSIKKEEAKIDYYIDIFTKAGVFSFIICFVFGILFFRIYSKRIILLNKSINKIKSGNYDELYSVNSKDELEDLSVGITFAADKIKNNIKIIEEDRQKLKDFINNFTHEFKTPITVIKAKMDLIKMYGDDLELLDKTRDIVDKEIIRLNNMVERVIDLSKLEQYNFEGEKEIINTKDIIEDIISRLSVKALKLNVKMKYELNDVLLKIDKESFVFVILNIIDNALKYNISGGFVKITNEENLKECIIIIEDSGVGISKNDIKRIFEPFYVVDKDRSKKVSGTGLGLSFVRKIVDKNNGSIEVKSTKLGTVFIIKFPNELEEIFKS